MIKTANKGNPIRNLVASCSMHNLQFVFQSKIRREKMEADEKQIEQEKYNIKNVFVYKG